MINIAQVAIKFNFSVSWQAPIYEQVIVVEEGKKEVMTFHMISYNQSEKPNKSCDSKVKVKLRRLRLVYINKFISRITVSDCIHYFMYYLCPNNVGEVQTGAVLRVPTTLLVGC